MDRQEETGHVGIDGYLQTVAGGAEYVPIPIAKSSIHGNCNKVVVALPTVEQTVQPSNIDRPLLRAKKLTMLLQPLQVNTTTLEGDISNTHDREFL
jgi:hypothetical protein